SHRAVIATGTDTLFNLSEDFFIPQTWLEIPFQSHRFQRTAAADRIDHPARAALAFSDCQHTGFFEHQFCAWKRRYLGDSFQLANCLVSYSPRCRLEPHFEAAAFFSLSADHVLDVAGRTGTN